MSFLHGKRILLFSATFFGYENEICKELQEQGAIVHFYDERNNPTSIEKIMLRKAQFLMSKKINYYYKRVSDSEVSFNPDFIVFISPETINEKSMKYLKEKFHTTKFILYMWDSIENYKNTKSIYKYFDKCFSFEPNDCKTYGFIFRPLFFIKKFEKPYLNKEFKYDFSFIGSIHSDRARILNSLRKEFLKCNKSFYYYLYVPGKLMLFLRSLLDKDFRELKKQYAHITSLTKEQISEIIEESNYIIDINHPKQVGLTMRTIEMLGSHKKLLTTNDNIKTYDFYNPSNEIVFDRKKKQFDMNNMTNDFVSVNENVYKKYKLSEWVKELFEE